MKNKSKILVVLGPTSSGKSALAVEIALALNGEVISADSRQVYTGLDIGTGKITSAEMKDIPHHLLDIKNPNEQCTVSEFKDLADKAIKNIISRNKIPIICGGTGFYIQSIVDNITLPEVKPNMRLRKELAQRSTGELFETLNKLDPKRAETIDKQNPRRLIRAIEIATTLGTVPESTPNPHYETLQIGIDLPDDILRDKITKRLFSRIKSGMIDEARTLHATGLSYERMEDLGLEYRSLAHYLQNRITEEEMIEKLGIEIWHYAKRQKTWFRRDPRIRWSRPEDVTAVISQAKSFLR